MDEVDVTLDTAFIFAAGFGTRMGSLVHNTPKPLLLVGGRPMIDQSIRLLREAGIDRIFANTHYLADQLDEYLRLNGVTPLREDIILDTGGGLRAALPCLERDVVITINPDVLWTGPNPITALRSSWSAEMNGLLMLYPTENEHDDFHLSNGHIARNGPFRYTGLQAIHTDRLQEIDSDLFSMNVYWDYILDSAALDGVTYNGEWTDIGTEEALIEARRVLG